MTITILGAGYSGLAAAWELLKAGQAVHILERDNDIGGLAGTFEISPGFRVEKFYHHWFTSDQDILRLIEELALSAALEPKSSNTGLYYANSIFRLANPLDLMKFSPLPLLDRLRTGLMALYARYVDDWKALESETAANWLRRIGGEAAYKVIWEPLLRGKFGSEAESVSAVWIWNKLKLRGSSRGKGGAESLLYFKGGFGALTDGIRERLLAAGAQISLNCEVRSIESDHDGVHVETSQGTIVTEQLLCTAPLPQFLNITKGLPAPYIEQCRKIRFLGNVCLVLRLKRSLSNTYWLNVADPSFPFVGIIEHTNFDDPSHYGGEHIAYLSKYLATDDPLFQMNEEQLTDYCIPYVQRIFPQFSREWLHGVTVWRAQYSQPVTTQGYSKLIPPFRTPAPGVWLCTMAQIYPEDRGTNYAVRFGRAVAREMLQDL